MPTRQAILVATGADRPGVLDDISLFLHDRHVAILESRVSLLRGQFGLLLLIRADDSSMAQFEQSIDELSRSAGINTEIRPASDAIESDNTPLRLTASGDDPAAAVFRLSHLMRVLNVNIENIETSSVVSRTSGTNAGGFTLEMELSVPRATPVMMLKQYVQSLADELKIECDVKSL
jgi:glycine cleavage system transcriptional repressor